MARQKKTPDPAPRPRAKDGSRRGGARPGSGRKTAPAKKLQVDLRQAVVERITERHGEILESLFTLAMGVKVIDPDKDDDGDGFYLEPPDRQACEYLLNQAIGKPTERKELSGPEGVPLKAYIGFDPDDV